MQYFVQVKVEEPHYDIINVFDTEFEAIAKAKEISELDIATDVKVFEAYTVAKF